MKHVVREHWESDDGFVFRFEPVEDTVSITKTAKGYEARYLVQDEICDAKELAYNEDIKLVHYHRDFYIEEKEIVSKDDICSWYNGEKIEAERDYWIFPVSALIHSGVWLSLEKSFMADPVGWDTSHVGACLVSKKTFKTKKKAFSAADCHISGWNKILGGEVFGVVREMYDKKKNPLEHDSCWGFVGLDYAKRSLGDF